MKTIVMAICAAIVLPDHSSSANAMVSSAEQIAEYEAVEGLPRDPNERTVEPPKNMKLFLLIGQSNMAGRAKPTAGDRVAASGAYRLNRDDKWSPATAPLHFDKNTAGYGPGDAFIRAYHAEHPGESVGVIPCAVGGSSIKTWGEGGKNLEAAIHRLLAAKPYGELAGVLWHQGETDALKMDESCYRNLFAQMVSCVRSEAGCEVPVVVGEIGRFMKAESERINPVIAACAESTPACECVTSEGLKNRDKFHFNRASAEELGRRYYAAWKRLAASASIENPVWSKNFPDPTVWCVEDGSWRATSTALTILKSRDFRCWEPTGKRVFTRADEKRIRQKWKNIWAPDVFRLGDEYLIYVSLVNCDTNSAIAVYSSKDPEGPFTDGRIITRSIDTGIRDTIDPEVVRDDRDGTLWLFFGSTGKMHRVKLSPDGKSLSPEAKYEHVAGLWGNENDDPARKRIFEAAYLYRRNSWWYLFVSRGFYANHTYSIAVGRAMTLDGPFLDRKGRKMTDGFATKVIASKKGDRFFGPGHNGEIVTVDGHDYITFHCHVAGEHSKDRPLFVAELTWDAADWPHVESLK